MKISRVPIYLLLIDLVLSLLCGHKYTSITKNNVCGSMIFVNFLLKFKINDF